MLQQDYLVKIFTDFARAIRLTLERSSGKKPDPGNSAQMLEAAIDSALDMDANMLLSLAPESVASILQVGQTDPRIIEYLCRTLLLESRYLLDADLEDLSDLREDQAFAIAEAYGLELTAADISPEGLEELFDEFNV